MLTLLGLLGMGFVINVVRHLFVSWKNLYIFPNSMPWAGTRSNEWFPKARACARELFAGLNSLGAGYDQVC